MVTLHPRYRKAYMDEKQAAYPVCTTSLDGVRAWDPPHYMLRHTSLDKHPQAADFEADQR